MEKVYLLLSHNQQTGPFTIDELLLQGLKPSDLIWEEGKSTAWHHPSELQLNGQQKNNNTSANAAQRKTTETARPQSRVAVNTLSPAAEMEQKAIALSQRSLEAKPQPAIYKKQTPAPDKSASFDMSFSGIDLTIHKRKREVSGAQLLVVTIVSVLVIGIFYGKWSPIKLINSGTKSSLVIPAIAGQQYMVETSPVAPLPVAAPVQNIEATEVLPAVMPEQEVVKKDFKKPMPAVAVTKEKKEEAATRDTTHTVKAVAEATAPKETTKEPAVKKEAKSEPVVAASKELEKTEAEPTSTTGKKKTLGQVLKNIFKKKKETETETVAQNAVAVE